jgi:hypothetical protein
MSTFARATRIEPWTSHTRYVRESEKAESHLRQARNP